MLPAYHELIHPLGLKYLLSKRKSRQILFIKMSMSWGLFEILILIDAILKITFLKSQRRSVKYVKKNFFLLRLRLLQHKMVSKK
jgi:hypothetical protein